MNKQIEDHIIDVEGTTYTNTEGDSGGPTKFGITQGALTQYLGRPATEKEVQDLTREMAMKIYEKNYWKAMGLDLVKDERVALMIMDQGINRGPKTAIMHVQSILNSCGQKLKVDGELGPKTAAALTAVGAKTFLREYRQYCEILYVRIVKNNPTQIKFIEGWINRIHKLEDKIDGMLTSESVAPIITIPNPAYNPVVTIPIGSFTKAKFADIAETEAKKNLVWSPGSEADKYKEKFWPVFGKGKWAWCAAFVTWCCEKSGLEVPNKFKTKFAYTPALVEAWQQWAIFAELYHDNDGFFIPQRGDITIFDWSQTDIDDPDKNWESHIGVFLEMSGKNYLCAEGNASNKTGIITRKPVNVQGFIRIPDGYKF